MVVVVQNVKSLTSSLYAVSTLCVIRPMLVASSAKFLIVLELQVAMLSCLNRENRRQLSIQLQGSLVLRVRVADGVLPVHTAWGLPTRKLGIQSNWLVSSPQAAYKIGMSQKRKKQW